MVMVRDIHTATSSVFHVPSQQTMSLFLGHEGIDVGFGGVLIGEN